MLRSRGEPRPGRFLVWEWISQWDGKTRFRIIPLSQQDSVRDASPEALRGILGGHMHGNIVTGMLYEDAFRRADSLRLERRLGWR